MPRLIQLDFGQFVILHQPLFAVLFQITREEIVIGLPVAEILRKQHTDGMVVVIG